MPKPTQQQLQCLGHLEILKLDQLLPHKGLHTLIVTLILVAEPQLKSPGKTLPNKFMAHLQRLYVVENLLNSPPFLHVGGEGRHSNTCWW
jgi:hypothetical protein